MSSLFNGPSIYKVVTSLSGVLASSVISFSNSPVKPKYSWPSALNLIFKSPPSFLVVNVVVASPENIVPLYAFTPKVYSVLGANPLST